MKLYCTTPGCGYSGDNYNERTLFPIWEYECPKCLRREFSAVPPTDQSELYRLRKQVKILEAKAAGSLANNLCPDHRDKVFGHGCLLCEADRLRNDIEAWKMHASLSEIALQNRGDMIETLRKENAALREALERIADPRNTHFAGDAQVVDRSELQGAKDD